MTQFYSRIDTEFHGDVYSIPFSYINKEEIEVYLDDVLFVDWEFLNESQIKFKNLPAEASNPAMVSIRRNTDISEKIVEYTNNTLLNKENLNLSQDQLLYAVQEIYDNNIQNNIDIKAEVDEKVEQVSDAVEKLEMLNEAVDTAVLAADTATKQVETITETVSEIENLVIQSEQLITEITQEGQKQIDNIESTGFYMRDDKLYFINSEGVETEFESGSGFNLFDTKVSDHILEGEEAIGWALQGTYVYKESVAGSRTGYPDFYAKCLEEKENSTATETTLGDNTITMYVNANGHTFYDIANKDVVDTFYNAIGTAWFYGIDTENERIFLPRNDYFVQLTGDTSKVNEYVEAGLPNIEGYLKVASNAFATEISGAFARTTTGTCHVLNQGTVSTDNGVYFDASASNDIYGNSDTVQPNAIKQLLYICVGNTKVESAITDVTQITTSENDTLPLFYNFYSKEDMTVTGAYANASLGEFLGGNDYKTAYAELEKRLGTGNVKSINDEYTDEDFVVNQDNMTFRLPLLNGDEDLPDYITATKITWGQDFTANCNGVAYLVRIAHLTASGTVYWQINGGVHHTFGGNESGASPITVQMNKGDVLTTVGGGGDDYISYFYPYKGNGNLYYKLANAVTNLELLDVAKVMNEAVLKSSLVEADVIVESYVNGTSGYNVYSNGYCEQWGRVGGIALNTWHFVNLLKEFKDTNYLLIGSSFDPSISTSYPDQFFAYRSPLQTTGFYGGVRYLSGGTVYADRGFTWKACGYIK